MEKPTIEEVLELVSFERDKNGKLRIFSVRGDVSLVIGSVTDIYGNAMTVNGNVSIVNGNVRKVKGRVRQVCGHAIKYDKNILGGE
jgi:hypothetical protein